jgi:outer membrane protein OmpA-like peptidoglycan-associated protein
MKKNFLMVLPLAASLAMPAIAQQSATDQQNAPVASQSSDQQSSSSMQQSSGDQSNGQLATGKEPLTYERHEGFWGKINPMARKKYVQRQIQPVRDRVNELDELTAANSKQIKDVDARAQQGIQLASAKATQADLHAIDAGNRAQQAQQTAQDASTRLTSVQTVVGNIDQYSPVTDTEIRFRPGQEVLSKKAKEALDEMADSVKDQKGYIVEVEGFAPGRGQAAVANSEKMAQSVVRYLVLNHDIPVYRIYLMGMGNARPRTASANGTTTVRSTSGGRVEVKLLKNGVSELAQGNMQNAAPTAPAGQGGMSGTTYQTPTQQPATTPAPSTETNGNQQPSSNLSNAR